MADHYTFIRKAVLIMSLLSIAAGLTSCGKRKAVKIEDFTSITISESGSRGFTDEYELLRTEDGARLTLYSGSWKYKDGADREEYVRFRVEGGEDFYKELLELLKTYKVGNWNGFTGSNPKGVLDGKQFTMSGTVNGETRIYATGSNNFPKQYRDFLKALDGLNQ